MDDFVRPLGMVRVGRGSLGTFSSWPPLCDLELGLLRGALPPWCLGSMDQELRSLKTLRPKKKNTPLQEETSQVFYYEDALNWKFENKQKMAWGGENGTDQRWRHCWSNNDDWRDRSWRKWMTLEGTKWRHMMMIPIADGDWGWREPNVEDVGGLLAIENSGSLNIEQSQWRWMCGEARTHSHKEERTPMLFKSFVENLGMLFILNLNINIYLFIISSN